jgi:hypothetical protein
VSRVLSLLVVAALTEQPAGASAQCRDGTYSLRKHRRGTCSHHGGGSQVPVDRRVVATAATMALCAVVTPATAQLSPIRFKEARIGASVDELWPMFRPDCRKRGKRDVFAADEYCIVPTPFTYATVPILAGTAHVWRSAIGRVDLSFNADAFPVVEEALLAKYGPPSATVLDTVQTRLGARFERVIREWVAGDVRLTAWPMAGTIDVSRLVFSWAPYDSANGTVLAAEKRRRLADM